jgi:hypothetical protein
VRDANDRARAVRGHGTEADTIADLELLDRCLHPILSTFEVR